MIPSVLDVVRRHSRPWLIVGKGPSLDGCSAACRESLAIEHNVLTLNHACHAVPPTIAHFADMEAFDDCVSTSRLLLLPPSAWPHFCLPWWPHVRSRPGRVHLGDRAAGDAGSVCALSLLHANGRLCSYNSTVASNLPRNRDLPEIRVRYFSAVAAFNILARAGCKRIVTLGVDGGTAYAGEFDGATRLANGRDSFDIQFSEIADACARHGITHHRIAGDRAAAGRPT